MNVYYNAVYFIRKNVSASSHLNFKLTNLDYKLVEFFFRLRLKILRWEKALTPDIYFQPVLS